MHHAMHPGIKHQRIDLGEKRMQEVVAEPGLLALVERIAFFQVVLGGLENLNDVHALFSGCAPWLPTTERTSPFPPRGAACVRQAPRRARRATRICLPA